LFNLLVVIPAIIKVLKMVAEDWRDYLQQQRALKALEQIDAQFIIDIGLIADYGSICLDLLRKCDVHFHNPKTHTAVGRAG